MCSMTQNGGALDADIIQNFQTAGANAGQFTLSTDNKAWHGQVVNFELRCWS